MGYAIKHTGVKHERLSLLFFRTKKAAKGFMKGLDPKLKKRLKIFRLVKK